MAVDARQIASWLLSTIVVLAILYVGRPLLAPLAFAILIWAILNALTDALERAHLPRALAWASSLVLIAAALYLIARILGTEADAVAGEAPAYFARLQGLARSVVAFLHLGRGASLGEVFRSTNLAGVVGSAAASAGSFLFAIVITLVYVGFLLAEQRHLPEKLSRLQEDQTRRDEAGRLIHTIARQVQAYLGVCTLLSALMGGATYLLLFAMHVSFAGFWGLILFLGTYIPSIGAVVVILPALMALLQFSSLAPCLVIILVLGFLHFVLTNIVSTIMLGRTLNLSPLAIILSLSFWGLLWGVAGLFLAVPITGALTIVCRHVDELNWIAIALSGPEPGHKPTRGLALRRKAKV